MGTLSVLCHTPLIKKAFQIFSAAILFQNLFFEFYFSLVLVGVFMYLTLCSCIYVCVSLA